MQPESALRQQSWQLEKWSLCISGSGKPQRVSARSANIFCKDRYDDRILQKCKVYGLTHSEATDWKQSYDACGLFPDKPYDGIDIVRLVRPERQRKKKTVS